MGEILQNHSENPNEEKKTKPEATQGEVQREPLTPQERLELVKQFVDKLDTDPQFASKVQRFGNLGEFTYYFHADKAFRKSCIDAIQAKSWAD